MSTELETTEQEIQKPEVKMQGDSSGAVYGLGVIGARVFFIGRANNFQEGLKGFLKGLFWPAYLVYQLLEFLEKERST